MLSISSLLQFIVAAGMVQTKGGGACTTLADCNGGGSCTTQARCKCDVMFAGPACLELDLLDVEVGREGWPQPPASAANFPPKNSPSAAEFPWGGALAHDHDGFHLFATVWMNHCPMRYDTFATSTQIVHFTSNSSLGPWTRREVAVPNAAGNPAYTRAPDGTHLLYYTCQRWTGSPPQNCTSNDTSTWEKPVVHKPGNCATYLNVSLAYSTSLSGPWEYVKNVLGWPASNPGGPLFLPNGTMMLPFQSWPPGTPCSKPSCITFATARHWREWPYNTFPLGEPGSVRSACIEQQNVSRSASVEDPSNIWRDVRGTIHLLMHEATFGSRAWSFDDGASWHYSYDNIAYPYAANRTDGSSISCEGREEPRLLLDPKTGQPTVFASLCRKGRPLGGDAWSHVLLQRLRTED